MADQRWLKSVFIIFFGQLVMIGLFSLFFYYTKDKITGISVISGGLVYCVPTLFAGVFMSRASNKSAALVLSKAYLGTLYKMIITIALFVYVFKNIPINIVVFFVAYAMTFVTQCVMSYV
ncbi:MAG: ATP synthase subunit I, partial [Psychromonas sp.]|nr:ATP synthase subunit I [Psychromonas sp.]